MTKFCIIVFGTFLFANCNNSNTKEVINGLANTPAESIDLLYSFQTIEAENLSVKAFDLKKNGKLQEAINVYKEAIHIERDNPKLYFDIAECYAIEGNIQEGIQSLDKAIQLDSSNSIFYSNRGLFHYHLHKDYEAINDLEKAVQLDSSISISYYNLAIAYYAVENLANACNAFKRAQRLGLNYEGISSQYEYIDLQKRCNQ